LNGNKPARLFTKHERNANRSVKQMYWERNHVWRIMDRLVQRQGDAVAVAAHKTRQAYGDHSITKTIKAIRLNPHHPNL
jgi:hypothetical protein